MASGARRKCLLYRPLWGQSPLLANKKEALFRELLFCMKLDSFLFSEIRICSSGKRSKHRPDLRPDQRQLRMHIQHGAVRS